MSERIQKLIEDAYNDRMGQTYAEREAVDAGIRAADIEIERLLTEQKKRDDAYLDAMEKAHPGESPQLTALRVVLSHPEDRSV